jgi:uncharacterized integral membrane protein (TIGR00698 family)
MGGPELPIRVGQHFPCLPGRAATVGKRQEFAADGPSGRNTRSEAAATLRPARADVLHRGPLEDEDRARMLEQRVVRYDHEDDILDLSLNRLQHGGPARICRHPFVNPSIDVPVHTRLLALVPGAATVTLIAGLALLGARMPWAAGWGLGALTLAIVLGMLLGNVGNGPPGSLDAGIDFCKSTVLRVGIVLFGLRITFQDMGEVGIAGMVTGVMVVVLTFVLAVVVGTRVLGLDRESAILIGAGASICGAAAVMATQAVVRARAETASVAIATVVVFGTLSMFLYPALYPVLGLSEHAYGVYVGSTVHEVAQVVAAGESVGQWAAATAVIEKMWRVMLLAPFLLVLGLGSGAGGGESGRRARDAIPWFAVAFIGAAVLNSLGVLPSAIVDALAALATPLLAIAMAALGLRTRFDSIREAGAGPLKLGMVLCAFLVVGGYVLNVALARLLS